MNNSRDWARTLLHRLNEVEDKAIKDPRASAHYWNGDNWGSISGYNDAKEWYENQMIDCILEHARPKVKQ